MALRRLDRLLVEVERDDLVLRVAVDAMDHVAAHLPEPYEADLHLSGSSGPSVGAWPRENRA